MQIVDKAWISFKKQPDFWFFCGFLVFFAFSIRKVIYFFPINGQFNEYASTYLYLSDILLLSALIVWIIILRHRIIKLSIYKKLRQPKLYIPLLFVIWAIISLLWAQNRYLALFRSLKLIEFYGLYLYIMFRIVPRGTFCTDNSDYSEPDLNSKSLIIQHPEIPDCHSGYKNNKRFVPRGTFFVKLVQILVGIGLFQAIIAILQFFQQSSIGLFWLKESLISSNMPGVAKIVLDGHKYIRAYGLFPHPNILAGFLAFSIILTLLYIKMFHVEHYWQRWRLILQLILVIQIVAIILTFSKSAILGLLLGLSYLAINVPRGTINNQGAKLTEMNICHSERSEAESRNLIGSFDSSEADSLKMTFKNCSTWNILYYWLWLLLVIQILATILFMSKMAFIGLFIVAVCLGCFQIFHSNFKNVPRGTLCGLSVKQVWKRYRKLIFLVSACLILLIYITKPNSQSLIGNSLNDRLGYINVSRGTILDNPVLGLGIGQYVPYLNSLNNLLDWQFQPVHNVFLLIWAELGIIGLVIFIVFLWNSFQIVPRGTICCQDIMQNKNCDKVEFINSSNNLNNDYLHKNNCCNCSTWNILIRRYFIAIFITLIFISLFDHYLWDIQQGQIMLWMVLGIMAGEYCY